MTRRSSFWRALTREAVSDRLISGNSTSRSADALSFFVIYLGVMNTWTSLSNEIETAVAKAAPSVVQVHGHRRVAAGVVIADGLLVTPAATNDDTIAVFADGQTYEGAVLGRIGNAGLTVVRAAGL